MMSKWERLSSRTEDRQLGQVTGDHRGHFFLSKRISARLFQMKAINGEDMEVIQNILFR